MVAGGISFHNRGGVCGGKGERKSEPNPLAKERPIRSLIKIIGFEAINLKIMDYYFHNFYCIFL